MRTVDVGIGHDDDAVITQLVGIVVLLADATAQRRDERAHLRRREHLVEARLFDIEDLALQRQDGLRAPVAPLLGRAPGGVALHQIDFRLGGVLFLAVGQFAGQSGDIERALAARHLARFSRCLTGTGRVDDLGGDGLGVRRVLLEKLLQLFGQARFDDALHLGGDELLLRLRRELRVRHLDRDDRRQPFPHVITGGADLVLLQYSLFFEVLIDRPRQPRLETRQVGAAVALRNVVGKAVDVLLVGVVPL